MNSIEQISIQLLQNSLFCSETSKNILYDQIKTNDQMQWREVYSFLCDHALAALVSDIDGFISKEYIEIKKDWKERIYSNIYNYSRLTKQQQIILNAFTDKNIPVAVVKGTSAAKYYPKPELRTMGDIDLLVKPEDYEQSVRCLSELGCKEITSQAEMETGRHRSFRYNVVSIELHHYFSPSADKDKEKAAIFDNLLFAAITNDSAVLPDDENGLVLLSHIRQHLEAGLGLRQIIDWMMFVNSCLDDEIWYSSFQDKAQRTGLDILAKTVTKMCQKYLGLTNTATENITWCESANEAVCDNLMQYVIDCGNFGRSRELFQTRAVSTVPSIKNPIQLFKYIQTHGERNWEALKQYPKLRPFAWIYQSFRYAGMAVRNGVGVKKVQSIYDEGQKRNEMFVSLGLK